MSWSQHGYSQYIAIGDCVSQSIIGLLNINTNIYKTLRSLILSYKHSYSYVLSLLCVIGTPTPTPSCMDY